MTVSSITGFWRHLMPALIMVYDYFPESTTVFDEHLADPRSMGPMARRRTGMPVQERLLWSYVTQISNALKAIHSSGLAARNLDPTKLLITGKNRIRLNGCGVLDVMTHDQPANLVQQQVSSATSPNYDEADLAARRFGQPWATHHVFGLRVLPPRSSGTSCSSCTRAHRPAVLARRSLAGSIPACTSRHQEHRRGYPCYRPENPE